MSFATGRRQREKSPERNVVAGLRHRDVRESATKFQPGLRRHESDFPGGERKRERDSATCARKLGARRERECVYELALTGE